jgi:hypothetical protein
MDLSGARNCSATNFRQGARTLSIEKFDLLLSCHIAMDST